MARCFESGRVNVRHGRARYGAAGKVWFFKDGHGEARRVQLWQGRRGIVRYVLARIGKVSCGRLGVVFLGLVGQGMDGRRVAASCV